MVDVTVKVLTAATNFDFLTLDEAKLLLNISPSDTSKDEWLAMQITIYSLTVAELCNRTFARERVSETWRELYNGRLFLTHWPVKEVDVESVVSAGYDYIVDGYELEEASGKLSNVVLYAPESTAWSQSVIVTYTGGFILPDEAPMPLKQAVALLILDQTIRMKQAEVAGIRQISHKESRVTFFDPNALLVKQASAGAKSQGMQAIEPLLRQYTRFWV
jgi:hypothetical protein